MTGLSAGLSGMTESKRQIQNYPIEGDAVAIHGKEGEFQGVCKTG